MVEEITMKRKFKIGQLVKVNVNNRVEPVYKEDRIRLVLRQTEIYGYNKEPDTLQLARITGVKLFQEGKYQAGSTIFRGYGSSYEDYDPAYLESSNTVTVWAVRLGYRNKEIYFFEEDIIPIDIFIPSVPGEIKEDIPYFWAGGYSKAYREKLSRESKEWPRDEKGRWSK
jgi:hypothetical protein